MAKRKRRYGGRSKAIPIMALAPIIPAAIVAWNYRGAGATSMIQNGVYKLTGIDLKGEQKFNWANAQVTLGLVVAGMVAHKIANRVGINRYVKRATLGMASI